MVDKEPEPIGECGMWMNTQDSLLSSHTNSYPFLVMQHVASSMRDSSVHQDKEAVQYSQKLPAQKLRNLQKN